MVDITHDWDDENYETSVTQAFEEYCIACYGVQQLSPVQAQETKQAFLSGIHWLASRDSYCPEELQLALRNILKTHNSFLSQSGNRID